MRLLEFTRVSDGWRLRVELSAEEASVVSTIFGVDVCETRFVSIEELAGRLVHGLLANRLRAPREGCPVDIIVSDVWLQSISPVESYSVTEKQLVEYLFKSIDITLSHVIPLARGIEELRKGVVAPCIDPIVSTRLQRLLEKLPLVCVRGLVEDGKSLLEIYLADSITPRYATRIVLRVNAIPDIMVKTWYRGLQSRLEGCIRLGGDRYVVYIGGVMFKHGYYYVNDCIVLEGYMAHCREEASTKPLRVAKLEELNVRDDMRDVVERWRSLGVVDAEAYQTQAWLYVKSLKTEDPVEYSELYLRAP